MVKYSRCQMCPTSKTPTDSARENYGCLERDFDSARGEYYYKAPATPFQSSNAGIPPITYGPI